MVRSVIDFVESDRALGAGVLTIAGAIFVTFAVYKLPPWPAFPAKHWRYGLHFLELIIPVVAMAFATLAVMDAIFVAGAYVAQSDESLRQMLTWLRWAIAFTALHFIVRVERGLVDQVASLKAQAREYVRKSQESPVSSSPRTVPRIAGGRRKRNPSSPPRR